VQHSSKGEDYRGGQLKETTRAASRVAKENHQLKSEVGSLRATVTQGHQQNLAWAEELEGKYLWLSLLSTFSKCASYLL
jgi:hypothetical protein